jgi:hypothetical protein
MCFKFLSEFTKDDQMVPIRDLKLIAERYLRTDFFYDLLPLLPLTIILDL